jgi:hypothetical protein
VLEGRRQYRIDRRHRTRRPYLPVTLGGANPFFQLVNAPYEKGAMILTSNRGFAETRDTLSAKAGPWRRSCRGST